MTLPKLTDVRQLFPSQYINHTDLIDATGKWRTMSVTIDRVEFNDVADAGRKDKAYVLFMKGRNGTMLKPLVLNATHKRAILSLKPKDKTFAEWLPQHWVGLPIELYIDPAVKSPPKWIPIYGKTMPGLRIKGRPADAEDMKDQLRSAAADAPPEFDDAPTH